jgi:hypothetical protein
VRDLAGEFIVSIAICLLGAAALLVWHRHPLLVSLAVTAALVAAGWIGYRLRERMYPGSSRLRKGAWAAQAVVLVGLGGWFLWLASCSCA